MVKKLIRDESGIALGLAVIMIVLIGVMGAGLLVFVRNDLEAVIEVNNGQKALDIADSGVQVARQQILSNKVPGNYDVDTSADEDYVAANCHVSGDSKDSEWSLEGEGSSEGATRNFADGEFTVTIQWLSQDPSTDPSCVAPETTPTPSAGVDYYRVISTGTYGDARRKVEAIYNTNQLDVPTAYYTPQNIEFNGSPDVSGVSFFAGGYIDIGNADFDRATESLYGDWDTSDDATPSNLNTMPRRTGPDASFPTVNGTGLAAEKWVCDNQCNGPSDSVADGIYDYDSTTGAEGSQKEFVRKTSENLEDPNAAGTISYPFNPNGEFDLDLLKQISKSQNNYYEGEIDIDTNNVGNNRKYPDSSTDQTVFYVKANGATIDYFADHNPKAKGLIVVENGDFEISNSSNGFDGVVIVTGDGTSTGNYKNTGNETIEGFVVADGTMTIGGTVDPFQVIGDFTQRPGFYGVQQWSWRELYQ